MECRKKWSILLAVIMMFAGMFLLQDQVCASENTMQTDNSAANTEVKKTPKNGWDKTKSGTYYYKKGRKVTGWCKISKNYYYFDKKTNGKENKNY